jgi:hypothetical protein
MNLPVHTTDTLLLEKYQGESVIEAFVHTILFHRLIVRMARPKEVAHPIYESIHSIQLDDEAVEECVKERVTHALGSLKERVSGTVALTFSLLRPASGWFRQEERTEVEKWRIPVQWYDGHDKSLTHAVKEQRVRQVYDGLLRMLRMVSLDPVPLYQGGKKDLPFDIVDSDKSNSLKDIFQFIVSGPPKLGLF